MSNSSRYFLLFLIDNNQFALDLYRVNRVIRSVAVSPMPNAPDIILGVINVHGDIVPVVNMRKRLKFPAKPLNALDHIIFAKASQRQVALWVDDIGDILETDALHVVEQESILPNMPFIEGVVKLENEIIYIQDLDGFLSLDDLNKLDDALQEVDA